MSVPPQVIHVKRKRTEEGPVAFLRLEENNKRYRSSAGTFLYKRNDPTAVETPAPAETRDVRPVIHVSKPGEEEKPPVVKTAKAAPGTDSQQQRAHKPIASPRAISTSAAAKRLAGGATATTATTTTTTTTTGGVQRRFHLSRSSTPATPPPVLGSGGVNKRSRYASPAVFVERGKRKKAAAAGRNLEKQASGLDLRSGGPRSPSPPESMDVEQKGLPARLPKRPGSKMAGSRAASAAVPSEAGGGLPKSLLNRWEVDTDELAREMNEYTLKQIGLNLARIEAEDSKRAASAKPAAAAASTATPLSPPRKASSSYLKGFKPKSPAAKKPLGPSGPEGTAIAAAAPRQQTQDEDVAMAEDGGSPESEEEEEEDDDDDEDYVTETYYRVPEQVLEGADINPEHVGLLVFDTEPDVEFFYGNESESEEDWEPDEDENAENYYTADYPDDEVASDDEYDQNAYHYRTGNASDLEEFDDDAFSGDEDSGGFKITIGGKKASNMY